MRGACVVLGVLGQMQEYISSKADEYTREAFGLRVKVVDWCRRPTQQERARDKAYALSEATRGTITQHELHPARAHLHPLMHPGALRVLAATCRVAPSVYGPLIH